MTPFEEVLGWHLSGGRIYSTKDVFLLASEVCWDPVSREILQPSAFSLPPTLGSSNWQRALVTIRSKNFSE